MNHRVAHLDTRWPTVRQDPTSLAFQDWNEAARELRVRRRHLQRRRQLTLKPFRKSDHGIFIGAADQE